MGLSAPVALSKAEETGLAFARAAGANSLADLRAMAADKLLDVASKPGGFHFAVIVDGYFFPKPPDEIFAAGEQAHVPLLVGWNSEEGNANAIIGNDPATVANYQAGVRKLYGDQADSILRVYAVVSDADVHPIATSLASDRFIGFSTWRWADVQGRTGGKPVYRYFYEQPRPATVAGDPAAQGASHSAEIEYAMGNLPGNKVFAWTKDDFAVSAVMQAYFVNFIVTGAPGGSGVPHWPAANGGKAVEVQHIGVKTRTEKEQHRERYEYWAGRVK
jgi:para-nitrobenzyl esterase